MDRLWAPWRSAYVKNLGRRKKCVFCVKRSTGEDARLYIIKRSRFAFSMLNLYPYNTGHLLISPYRHISVFEKLSSEELHDMVDLLVETKRMIDKALKPHGYNIGINIGKASGAGFDGHLHIHVVPRWLFDSNFISTVADTRVVSHSLDAIYKLFKETMYAKKR